MFGKILQCFKTTESPEQPEIIMQPLFTDQEIEELSAFGWVKTMNASGFVWHAYHGDKSIYATVKFNDGIYELYTADENTCELIMRNRYIDLEAAQAATSRLYKNELIKLNRMFR